MTTDDERRAPDRADMRAADADRDRVAELLREHCASGRLTAEELEERLDVAYRARRLGELEALTADLPRELSQAEPPRVERRPCGWPLRPGLMLAAALIAAIAVASGGEGLWLLWPVGFLWLKAGRWGHHRRVGRGRERDALPPHPGVVA